MTDSFSSKALLTQPSVDEHVYRVQTRGYSLLTDYLSPTECDTLKRVMTEAIERYKPYPGSERSELDQYQMHDLICQKEFASLLEDPRLDQLIAPFLGPHWIMYAATSSSVPPRGSNYSSRLHIDCPRFQAGYVFNMGIIWTLDEYTEENGAVKVLPGSHHCETEPTESLFESDAVRVTCPPGSLIVFNARVFHRTEANHTDNWRHSMTLNACRPFMKQRMDWVRMIPEPISNQLSPQARRLIGFDTRLPTSLDELFLPEEERLYKPNQG